MPKEVFNLCTSIAVGQKATQDNVILISRNEDCLRNNWNKFLIQRDDPEYIAFKNTAHDGNWVLGNGMSVPVPDVAYSYSGTPDAGADAEATSAIGNHFYYEERGINERNFAISATNSLSMNKAASIADPLVPEASVIEAIIPTLLLPQAHSAQHAIKLLGQYVETYGAGEANGVLLADLTESWYFEIGSGHHWIAVKIPDDQYIAVANGMRVHNVNLEDAASVRCSTGLFEFVVEHKLLDSPDPQNFDFAAAFGDLTIPANFNRIWLAQSILSPSVTQPTGQYQYPLFMKPDETVAVSDVMRVLTATYEGTPLEGKATRSIGWSKTAESHIITLDPAMPDPLAGIIWQAISTPICAPYMPLYRAMEEVPAVFSNGSNDYGTTSAYWAFRGLYSLAHAQGAQQLAETQQMWRDYVARLIADQGHIKKMIVEMDAQDPDAAVGFVSRYSTGVTYEAVAMAYAARNKLMTAIAQEATRTL